MLVAHAKRVVLRLEPNQQRYSKNITLHSFTKG